MDKATAQAQMRELIEGTERPINALVLKAISEEGYTLDDLFVVVNADRAEARLEILLLNRAQVEERLSQRGYDRLLAKEHSDGMVRILYRMPAACQAGALFLGPPMVKGGDA